MDLGSLPPLHNPVILCPGEGFALISLASQLPQVQRRPY